MFSKEESIKLGLPMPMTDISPATKKHWHELVAAADAIVLSRFNALSENMILEGLEEERTPHHLYRSIAPIGDPDRSIAFLGLVGTTQSLLVAEIQSLWSISYLMGDLEVPSFLEMEEEVALRIAWRRRRYLGDGHTMIYDQIAYQSMLVKQLGLDPLRKGGGWRELFRPYCPKDYRGLMDEWLDFRRSVAAREHGKAGDNGDRNDSGQL